MNPPPQENQPGEAPPTTNLVGISSKLVGGPEAIADGESRPTSAEVCEMMMCESTHLMLQPNRLYRFTVDPNCDQCVEHARIAGPRNNELPPEPAAIPKTTSAREWWIVDLGHPIATAYRTEASALYWCKPTEIHHVREVGEGRKVSAAGELSARITQYLCVGGLFNPEMMEHDKVRDLLLDCRELLCVLSEEGGRQKEGGTKITSASKSSETSVGCSQKSLEDQIDTMLNVASGLRAQLLAEHERAAELVKLVEFCIPGICGNLMRKQAEARYAALSPPPVVGPRQD